MLLKKIEYIIPDLITPYVKTNYPLYYEMCVVFARYLDENSQTKILNLEDNLSSFDIYSELLDYYLDEFFTQAFDLDRFGLTDDNKKIFIDRAEIINSLKGTAQGFGVFLQSFLDIEFASKTGIVEIPDFGEVILQQPTEEERIYQYNIRTAVTDDEELEVLLDSVHPAGMLRTIFESGYNGNYNYDGTITYIG